MIKITVMKIACYKDLIEKYENDIEHACNMELGKEFILNELKKPDNMCDSAWQSMYPFIKGLFEGESDFLETTDGSLAAFFLDLAAGFSTTSSLVLYAGCSFL